MLSGENISFVIDKKPLLSNTTVQFAPGLFHVIMGANGAGKSTLLKILAGDVKPSSGRVLIGGTPLAQLSKKVLATQRAVLSQHYHISFPIAVSDIVMMGRYPYYSNQPTAIDREICERALERLDVAKFRDRDYGTLSGGEAQKVQMSRVLAQIGREAISGKTLFLDEPVSHLDIKYQYQLLEAAKELCKEGVTVIAVLHDINLAISFADRILFMKSSNMAYEVHSASALTPAMLQDIFDVQATILQPGAHKPVVIF
ncbi:MAG: heme transporter ATP-binding protein [Flaviaesturariibacter sp.]|nr:heme transporter ATP-binding protein [Flaviaesturariibacter sp.]